LAAASLIDIRQQKQISPSSSLLITSARHTAYIDSISPTMKDWKGTSLPAYTEVEQLRLSSGCSSYRI
jgi:hypothetical protein